MGVVSFIAGDVSCSVMTKGMVMTIPGPRGRSVSAHMMSLIVVVSTWRHDLISPLPGAPQHDILIMKLTAAKKMDPEKSPGMTNRPRPRPQHQHAPRDDSMTVLT